MGQCPCLAGVIGAYGVRVVVQHHDVTPESTSDTNDMPTRKTSTSEFVHMYSDTTEKSRAEPGCLHFDVLREVGDCGDRLSHFICYEVFNSDAARAQHMDMDYAKLSDAKPIKMSKAEPANEQGMQDAGPKKPCHQPIAFVQYHEIASEKYASAFEIIYTENAVESRKEPGCLRFDLLRVIDQENGNKWKNWISYEVFESDEAHAKHRDKDYVKKWGAFKYSENKPVKTTVHKTVAVNWQQ